MDFRVVSFRMKNDGGIDCDSFCFFAADVFYPLRTVREFLQPLIVLMEIPIDTAFALLALWVFGHTLNLMSAIGIIVTCGIVVNDSILKWMPSMNYGKWGCLWWKPFIQRADAG